MMTLSSAQRHVPDLPDVSILIPSYVRPDSLRRTLAECRRQRGVAFEIVLVDDATPGDAIADAARDFPEVRYHRAPRNLGLIGARNFGLPLCRARYVVNLDDDSWIEPADGLRRIVDYFDAHADVAVLALNIRTVGKPYEWAEDAAPAPVAFYTGCGNAYRRDAVAATGPYCEKFWRQGEELDRAMRIVDAGHRLMSLPGVTVYHDESPINRSVVKNQTLTVANLIRNAVLRAPLASLPYAVARSLFYAARRWRSVDGALLLRELSDPERGAVAMFRHDRLPVSSAAYRHWWRLGAEQRRRFRRVN